MAIAKNLKQDAARLRAFNRFFTQILGLLNKGVHKSTFSLPEARVMFEIDLAPGRRASDLAGQLNMDTAQLSRIIARLTRTGMLSVRTDMQDRRAKSLSLSAKGKKAVDGLKAKSDEQAVGLMEGLSPFERESLIEHVGSARLILKDKALDDQPVYRLPRAGDIGQAISRQALLYNREFGWDETFEHLLLEIYHELATTPDPSKARMIVADLARLNVGSLFVLPADEPGVAKLRVLYVEPFARGRGIGKGLVAEAISFAREAGFQTLTLWTQDCLTSARPIYQEAGFKLVGEEPHHSFGVDLNGQHWQLSLK